LRVVFRYASALAARGWQASVLMPSDLGEVGRLRRAFRRLRYWAYRPIRFYRPDSWIRLHPSVRLAWVADLSPRRAPEADAVVATAVQTAEAVARWPETAGRRFYLIQGYETWDFPRERVEASWRLPFVKLAVSRWLCDLVAGAGERAVCLRNSADPDAFGLDRPVAERREPSLLWPHHALPWKGSGDVVAALGELRAAFPGLRARAFGIHPRGRGWPEGVEYVRNPSAAELRALYNASGVMVAPSHAEGWGLPACEALQCGCAVAASAVGGHREFLREGENALFFAPGDRAALAGAARRLLGDPALRSQLAAQGVADMRRLAFEPTVDLLCRILEGKGAA
jgi:glycosyltransferase involved in cell wall biosynthesis